MSNNESKAHSENKPDTESKTQRVGLPWREGATRRVIYLDTETGGLYSSSHAVTSIGAVALEIPSDGPVKALSQFTCALKPHPNAGVNFKALQVQGLTWSSLDDPKRMSELDALLSLNQWLTGLFGPCEESTAPKRVWPIFAHNADFDRGFLSSAVRRALDPPKDSPIPQLGYLPHLIGRDARWVCTRYLAEALCVFGCMDRPEETTLPSGRTIKAGVSLDSLAHHFKIGARESGHDALGDARLGSRVLSALVRRSGWIQTT